MRKPCNRCSLLQILPLYGLMLACLVFLLFGASCGDPKAPEFVKMKDWKVQRAEGGVAKVQAVAVFYNPNKIGLRLKEVRVDIFHEKDKLGTIVQSDKNVKVAKEAAFDVPLEFEIEPAKQIKLVAGKLLTILTDKKVIFDYKGYTKLQKAGISFQVPIEGQEAFSLSDFKE